MEEEREKHIHRPRPHSGVGKSQGLTSISRRVVQNKHQDVPSGAGGDGLQEQVLEEGLGLQGGTGAEAGTSGYQGHVFEGGAKWFGFGSVVRALHQQLRGWVLFLVVTAGPWH